MKNPVNFQLCCDHDCLNSDSQWWARSRQSDLIELRSESCPRPKYYLAATPLTTTGFIHSISDESVPLSLHFHILHSCQDADICDMRCMQFCASAANLSTRMHLTPFDARGGLPSAALGASHNPPGGRGTGKVGADGDGKSDPGSVDAAPAPSSQVGLGRVEPCGASSHQDSTSFVRFCQISTQLPCTSLRCID